MKICAYEVRDDEKEEMTELAAKAGIELIMTGDVPGPETAAEAEGCEGVTFLGQGHIDRALLDIWDKMGIRYMSTRTIGFNHIDLEYAHSLGMKVCCAAYPPSGVAEFTVMMALMSIRNYKQSLWRGQVNDFSLNGLIGKELCDMTVGVIGTGRIGAAAAKLFSSFGSRIIAWSDVKNPSLEGIAEYVDLDELYARSDLITLHVPLVDSTYHLINDESIAKMKDGVVIINCARGELADVKALIRGIESGRIGALGLDVVEGEVGITHKDRRIDIFSNKDMAYLRQFRNVTMTPHMAFYTDSAVKSMVRCGLSSIVEMSKTGTCATII